MTRFGKARRIFLSLSSSIRKEKYETLLITLRDSKMRALSADKERVLRATISTLQDLGFVIDRADMLLGSVSGTKLQGYQIKITVSVRPKGSDRMLVRANAQFNIAPVEAPEQYQDFFSSLEKSLFLSANAGE